MGKQKLILKSKNDFENWYCNNFLKSQYEYPICSEFPEDYPCIVKWFFRNYRVDNGYRQKLHNGEKCLYYNFYYKDDFDFSFDNLKFYTKNDLLNEN